LDAARHTFSNCPQGAPTGLASTAQFDNLAKTNELGASAVFVATGLLWGALSEEGDMRRLTLSFLAALLLFVCSPAAFADTAIVVALGASLTHGTGYGRSLGSGVDPSQAFPAQLEALLRAKGVDAQVINAGRMGDTTGGVLSRLDSDVPAGTKVAIFEGPMNDTEKGLSRQTKDNISAIFSKLRDRDIKIISLPQDRVHREVYLNDSLMNGDHPNAAGQAKIAGWLLPLVLSALRAK
jgi:acyl-CoA thioesterase-1